MMWPEKKGVKKGATVINSYVDYFVIMTWYNSVNIVYLINGDTLDVLSKELNSF